MRILLFFDLPTETTQNRREYARFRKYLIKRGFMMMQESVYCRLALNSGVLERVISDLRKNKPSEGLIQILTVTEKQFSKMEFLLGDYHGDVVNSDERLIVL
ncbi:MAG: CRISPR-associated endonuclease Cas2 [Oscillospiraceae bacterium]|nr:CRISPR-associated endonuclease Cas2 [Oscillospiraceae bacterium]